MVNLRVVSVNVVNSTTITAQFTKNLNPDIGANNISIISQADGVPSPSIVQTSIQANVLTIVTQPLTPQSPYLITFQSTSEVLFQSLNGDATLFQDGITNTQIIIGPIDSSNTIQQFLLNYYAQNIYESADSSKLVNKLIQSMATLLSKALYDVRQVKNENYLSFIVQDEQKVRGTGPFDRLLEEGAYEVLRVGKTPTGTISIMHVPFNDFPFFPVTLLANPVIEFLHASNVDGVGIFNINDFTLTVSNPNVSQLTSVVFNFSDGYAPYTYNIQNFGYQILNSEYDQNFGFSYASLNNNQFKLSETVLNDPNFHLLNITQVQTSYQFKNLGRIINPATVSVTTVLSSARETLPPIINIFALKHAPIVNSLGNSVTTGGVIFIDPNAIVLGTPHPAFLHELPFSFSALPTSPGQYAIDYATGTVYVYGQDTTNSGTGPYPPLATYKYLYTYQGNIDYAYDSTVNDLVALPNGSLINNAGTINFNYEQVLIPGVDYNADTHIEVLSESITNNLLALNAIAAQNTPITNVFRIYNETSGEIYGITRWDNNKIYFTYNNAPAVDTAIAERPIFSDILNEILFVTQSVTNSSNITVFKCDLASNNIIAATQDCVGSSINTAVSFSNLDLFVHEKWWDSTGIENEVQNIDRLTSVGQYEVDYKNGVVYVAVPNGQPIGIGTISYKSDHIAPQHPHVLSVNDIYYRTSVQEPKTKKFAYQSFSDGVIVPSTFDRSDESLLNGVPESPYEVLGGKIGAIVDTHFVSTVSESILFVRGIYEYRDLQNNIVPLNFVENSFVSGSSITMGHIERQEVDTVLYDPAIGYYINLNFNLQYLSPNIVLDISVIRNSDSAQLWNSSGGIITGDMLKLVLPGINSPQAGNSVVVTYSFSVKDFSRVIVDYNKGNYYVDYSYLADEIIISYEYGDNVLDFRQSMALNTNEQYYASYKVGALRDALLNNFGMLVNIPELSVLDIDLARERYRDAVTGALESFIIGPTIPAMKSLVESITHVEPEIIESVFNVWSLGNSLLTPRGIETTGTFALAPAKFGNGVLVNQPGQTITFPVSSNLKLEQGSFQCWVLPEWNGLDNDAALTFNIQRGGVTVLPTSVFIGAAEYHPIYDLLGNFTVDKNANTLGTPNKNKDGIFVYYDYDKSGLFKRWYCDVVDGYVDGHIIDGGNHNYSIKINTPGVFYDVKSMLSPQPSASSIRSGKSSINFTITSATEVHQGITFIADLEHFLFDFGNAPDSSRLSIYKDFSGYMNFRAIDNKGKSYTISADVSSWVAYDLHHVAASWAINTKTSRDEIHLFIDGFEVPNIIRYGNKITPYPHELFRTIEPEEIVGAVTKNIVGSVDLVTTAGSPIVSSSLAFDSYGIESGGILYINESGFNGYGTSGYTILNVNGNLLTLAVNMPFSITDGNFSINTVTLPVQTEIGIYPNIAVSTISPIYSASDLVTTSNSTTVTSASTNFSIIGVRPGYLLRVDNDLFESSYNIASVSGNSVVLDDSAPISLSNQTFHVYPNAPVEIPGTRALRPSYYITQDGYYNYELVLTNNVSAYDLIYIYTLGLNHKSIKQRFYQWGNTNNVIQTRMATPIDLNTTDITHILLSTTAINGSSITIAGNTMDQPSESDFGRTLALKISSGNATWPINVTINGYVNAMAVNETHAIVTSETFYSAYKYTSVTSVTITGTPINTNRSLATLQISEKFPITHPEDGSLIYPVIRYSYQTLAGFTLQGTGTNILSDSNSFFSSLDVGNYLVITTNSPTVLGVAGTYQILAVSNDNTSITINATLPAFTNGSYQVLNTTTFRNGFQNGLFVLEVAGQPGVPYPLTQGIYEFDFFSYLTIKFDPVNEDAYIGTNLSGKALFDGVIDEIKITSTKLTDTRVGEVAIANQETITKDFNAIKPLLADQNTLFLSHFDTFPFTNVAPYYIASSGKFVQSGASVNANFNQSVYLTKNPIIIENNGILNSKQAGTIEFWINPLFDTANDPNYRFYFDAAGIEIENVVSLDDVTVQTVGRIGQVLSVTLQAGDKKIDYFAGGKVEVNSVGAISETALSENASTIEVVNKILQVVTVKLMGDPTNTDYFSGGTIGTNGMTIYLGTPLPESVLPVVVVYKPLGGSSQTLNNQVIRLNRRLPNQNMPVTVTYVPAGLQGDRISIFKDPAGYINFNVRASGIDYLARAPAFWSAGSWHRVKATYSVNGGKGTDTIKFFVDGYERGNILFGTGLLFGQPYVFGSTFAGLGSGIQTNIVLKDFLGELYIGSDYTESNGAFALIDNLRISDIARPIFAPYGESIDVNYSTNLNTVFPVTSDLYTTLLLDFNTTLVKNNSFVTLVDKTSGIYNFSINIFDSFGIVSGSAKVREILETLINTLKPASSRVFLTYIT